MSYVLHVSVKMRKVSPMADTEQRSSPHVAVNAPELRRRRHLGGYNMAEFADLCGLSAGYISLIESGARPTVSPGVYVRICDALGVDDRTQLMAAVVEEPSGSAS
jgi:transcriptional regulator with XRE-family HTH domain